MKRSLNRVFALVFFFGSAIYASAQCCPEKEKTGQRDRYLYESDQILMDVYTDPNDDWMKWIGENIAPEHWECNKFIRLRAWSDRTSNTENYIQLYWWIGDGTDEALTQTYANGLGPKAGTYTVTNPMMGRYGSPNSYAYFWTHTEPPTTQPYLIAYRTHKYFLEDYGELWVCPFSSYASNAGDLSENCTKYVGGEEGTSHIAHFNSLAVTVDTGDDGNIYIQIGGQECDSYPAVTIGRKTRQGIHQLNVTTTGSGGSVGIIPSCGYYAEGDVITLVPVPSDESTYFEGWTGEHAGYIQDNGDGTYSVTMQGTDMNITASFETYLDVRGTFAIDNACGDDNALTAVFVREQGHPVFYNLLFSEAAKAQGFADLTGLPMPDAAVVPFTIPMPKNAYDELWYARPDVYDVTLQLMDKNDRLTQYNASFTVLYPSRVILQRWNDILTVTNTNFNGGYTFSHIQWYADGLPVDGNGEDNHYYYAGDNQRLRFGVPYRAEITRADDGKTVSTCDFIPVPQQETVMFKTELNIAPRRTGDQRQVEVRTSLSGRYTVYDVGGRQVMTGWFGQAYGSPDILFPASLNNGTYLIRFAADEGKDITRKWIVW